MLDDAVAMVSRYGKIWVRDVQDWPHGYLPHGTGPPLEREVLCRYLPALWSSVSAVHLQPVCHWIMATNYGADLIHYLDDFLLAHLDSPPVVSQWRPRLEYVRGWASQLPWTSWKVQ